MVARDLHRGDGNEAFDGRQDVVLERCRLHVIQEVPVSGKKPDAILYDEPTTMVDPLMGHLLGDLIARLKTQLHLTSIIVTHDMRFAEKLADRVVFLHDGHARFFGTMEEMRKSDDPILHEFLSLDELVLPV